MQAFGSIGSALSGGEGFWHGFSNLLNLGSGLASFIAPLAMGKGFNPMSLMTAFPLISKGLGGMLQHPDPVAGFDPSIFHPAGLTGTDPSQGIVSPPFAPNTFGQSSGLDSSLFNVSQPYPMYFNQNQGSPI